MVRTSIPSIMISPGSRGSGGANPAKVARAACSRGKLTEEKRKGSRRGCPLSVWSERKLDGNRLLHVDVDGRKPAVAVRAESVGDAEELIGQLAGDGAGVAIGDRDAVDGTDGRDLRRSTGEEDFVSNIKQLARQRLLDHRHAEVASQREHAVARNAGEHGVGKRGGVDNAVAHDEEVLAGAFGEVSVDVEGDAFSVAVDVRFHADELRVEVVSAGLGERGRSVGRGTVPGGNAD